MARLINAADFDAVTFWDVHNLDAAIAVFEAPKVVNVEAAAFVAKMALTSIPVVVAPDKGATTRAFECATALNTSWLTADKKRDPNDGKITGMELMNADLIEPQTADFLMVDDICDGGRTFIELAKILRPLTTGKILLYVTHGIFSTGFAELIRHIDHIYTPNPFQMPTPLNSKDDPRWFGYVTRL